jgi:hypothetical protein
LAIHLREEEENLTEEAGQVAAGEKRKKKVEREGVQAAGKRREKGGERRYGSKVWLQGVVPQATPSQATPSPATTIILSIPTHPSFKLNFGFLYLIL